MSGAMNRSRSYAVQISDPDRRPVRDHVVRRMRELVEGSFMAGVVDLPQEGARYAVGGDLKVLTPEEIESASVGCGDILATFVLANISQSWLGWETPQRADMGIRGILSTALDDLEQLRGIADGWDVGGPRGAQ